jgi:excisionase family DNA binding protein
VEKPSGALAKREAAEFASCSTRFLDKAVAKGELRKVKLGAKTVFRVTELERWLESKEVELPKLPMPMRGAKLAPN